ncbi:hypothetical protein D3C78_1505180 [compost metagenome]
MEFGCIYWQHDHSNVQQSCFYIFLHFFGPILMETNRNLRITFMKLTNHRWKKARSYHWRQADADVALLQIP